MRPRRCATCRRWYLGWTRIPWTPPREVDTPWAYDPKLCEPCNQRAFYRSLPSDEHEREATHSERIRWLYDQAVKRKD